MIEIEIDTVDVVELQELKTLLQTLHLPFVLSDFQITELNITTEGAAMQDPAGQAMDADHSDHEEGLVVKRALVAQGELIGRHEQLLQQIMQQLTQLTQASSTPPVPTATTPPMPQLEPQGRWSTGVSESQLPHPDKFDGDPERCRGFLIGL
ncbi:hypothetical protein NFI96_020917 [Prochilodus magdalenae]|nr:hypothetical protein NFI96_020917 [Prochilodus magdalenae]